MRENSEQRGSSTVRNVLVIAALTVALVFLARSWDNAPPKDLKVMDTTPTNWRECRDQLSESASKFESKRDGVEGTIRKHLRDNFLIAPDATVSFVKDDVDKSVVSVAFDGTEWEAETTLPKLTEAHIAIPAGDKILFMYEGYGKGISANADTCVVTGLFIGSDDGAVANPLIRDDIEKHIDAAEDKGAGTPKKGLNKKCYDDCGPKLYCQIIDRKNLVWKCKGDMKYRGCTKNSDCKTGLICYLSGSQCVGDLGAKCKHDGCASGLTCDSKNNECRRSFGGSCTSYSDCLDCFRCRSGKCTGKCQNQQCSGTETCDINANLKCSNSLCKGTVGAGCGRGGDSDCFPNLGCSQIGSHSFQCRKKYGDSCTKDGECGDCHKCENNKCNGSCTNKKCDKKCSAGKTLACESGLCKRNAGLPCKDANECLSRLRCKGGRCKQ